MPLNGSLDENSVYLALKTRPHVGQYHWGLVLTDSHNKPVLHHASNLQGPWSYEARVTKPDQSLPLIALIKVAKVKSHSRAIEAMTAVPADGSPSLRTGADFSCRIWVKDALASLQDWGEIALPADVDAMERTAVQYGLKYAPYSESGHGATVINDAF